VNCLYSAPANLSPRHQLLAFRKARGKTRGFTLTEILVVILMIAILAAVASPSFVKVMRDTNLNKLQMQIAEVYRKAYLESAAQSTYLVRWTGGNAPKMELVKATLDSDTPTLVSPRRCDAIVWTDPAHTRQTVTLSTEYIPKFATVGFLNNQNQEKLKADICYSQRRAYVRYDDGVFTELAGAARIYVYNTQTKVTRKVLIPAFGLPRLAQ
jgi:prepilin-type N-terminal cleavage/methylation domain-containing protein